MTTTTTHENPIRRIDLVHHPTIDSKEKKDPYKYGEGVAARPFRYGFASVDRAIDRKERLEQQQQQRKMADNPVATTASSGKRNSNIEEETRIESTEAEAVNSNNNRNDHHDEEATDQKKKYGCLENVKWFFNSKKHPGASDEAYNTSHKRDDIIAPNGGASGVAPDEVYRQ
mmetsp:Transcript_18954/g.45773  ORF Transcript_18954/g.45773 Transcript_18954/m.45773 type:complete len:172 (+) Transcript_18954:117-632(+)